MATTEKSKSNQFPQFAKNAILNPKMPHSENIPSLNHGDLVILNGFVPKDCKKFSIYLEQRQKDGTVNVPLHVIVNFQQHVIIRNSCTNGTWSDHEEKDGGFAGLDTNKSFECVIMMHDNHFKIGFNGRHFADFQHRFPPLNISHLSVEGPVQLRSSTLQTAEEKKSVKVSSIPPITDTEDSNMTSNLKNGSDKLKPTGDHKPSSSYGLTVPLKVPISNGMNPSSVLYISGVPRKMGEEFVINLSVGEKDVALHFKVMLKQKTVVLNTMEKGKWGDEVRMSEYFPFRRGVHYDLMVLCEPDKYMISVNNRHLADYPHRIKKLNQITYFEVKGTTKLVHYRMM